MSKDVVTKERIKEKVGMDAIAFQHINRILDTMSGFDETIFETNVRGLLALLPLASRQRIYDKGEEYNDPPGMKLVYKENCGVQMGTAENPIVRFHKYPEYDLLKQHPDWKDMEEGEDYDRFSPTWEETEGATNYEKLLEFIFDELEKIDLSWSTERRTLSVGMIERFPPPENQLNEIASYIADNLAIAREEVPKLSYRSYVNALVTRQPPATPYYTPETQEKIKEYYKTHPREVQRPIVDAPQSKLKESEPEPEPEEEEIEETKEIEEEEEKEEEDKRPSIKRRVL